MPNLPLIGRRLIKIKLKMIYFDSDYMAGAHPEVLQRLVETNNLHTPGYGTDDFTRKARNLILEKCEIPYGEVYFLVGGTQTNAIVIDRLLDKNDGVVAVDTSHINVHEAGAIEAWGHKILVLPNQKGKMQADNLKNYLEEFYADDTYPHMVRPGMVYISFPTELGTVYTKKELTELYEICKSYEIPLYIDGARLAFGLSAKGNDIEMKDLPKLCDVFYIGGTKCGALFGEAVVTGRPELLRRFDSMRKLHGALLAKGRLLGVQFEALFSNNLYQRIGKEGVKMAMELRELMKAKGFNTFIDSPTNQQFFILPNEVIEKLKSHCSFEYWGAPGSETSHVRFVTGWSTTEDDIASLAKFLNHSS